MKACSCLLVLLLAGLVFPAGAASAPNHLDQAASAFANLDFEGALGLLQQALEKPGNHPGDLVRIYSLRGLCLAALGRGEQARRAFRAALSIDPGWRLDPDVSPRFREPFDQVLAAGVQRIDLRLDFPVTGPGLLRAQVANDPERLAHRALLHWRPAGRKRWSTSSLVLADKAAATLPWPPPLPEADATIKWWAELLDSHGGRLLRKGDERHPLRWQPAPLAPAPAAAAASPPVTPAPAASAAPPWYRRWWVWALVGAAAVAAGTTAGVLLTRPTAAERDFGIEVH